MYIFRIARQGVNLLTARSDLLELSGRNIESVFSMTILSKFSMEWKETWLVGKKLGLEKIKWKLFFNNI